MGLTRKVKRNLDNSSGLPPELQDSINSLFDDFYGKEDDDDDDDEDNKSDCYSIRIDGLSEKKEDDQEEEDD